MIAYRNRMGQRSQWPAATRIAQRDRNGSPQLGWLLTIKLPIAIELLIEIGVVIETTNRRGRRNSPEAGR